MNGLLRAWTPRLCLVAALLLALACDCATWGQVFVGGGKVNFIDADCYSRMTRVAEVCAHPGRIIRWHTFENYPFGVRPHTTAVFDYLIAALSLPLRLFWGVRALDFAGAWVSPLLGLATAAGLWAWAQRERLAGAWLMLLVFAASPILAQGFALGRPDHQSLALACVAMALAAEWAQWRAPSRGWGLVSGVAWAVGLWTTLYEPLILLVVTLLAAVLFHRQAFRERERLPGLIVGVAGLALALGIEGLRLNVPGQGRSSEYFANWAKTIGELSSVPPWSPTLYGWTGRAILLAPFLLLWRRTALGRAQLLLLIAMFALTCWQVRWGYFLALVYAMTLPEQIAAFPAAWRGWAGLALAIGLWPMAAEWNDRFFHPTPDAVEQLAEQREDTALLREAAGFIARESAALPPDGPAGIIAPWWLSPPLAYWSGQPAVAGSSHESLPGTVDVARFYLAETRGEIEAILLARQVRWVIAYEPSRVFQTAAPLLQRQPTSHSMGALLYDRPEFAPPGLRLAMVNKYFKVYAVTSAFFMSESQDATFPYDFIVLGGGSAGFAAARTACSLGLRTAVVEGGAQVGGLCILHGCMPSKTLIESANRFMTLRRAKEFGLRAENIAVLAPEIQARKDLLISEFADYRRGQLEKGPFDFFRGRARFLDEHHLGHHASGRGHGANRCAGRAVRSS